MQSVPPVQADQKSNANPENETARARGQTAHRANEEIFAMTDLPDTTNENKQQLSEAAAADLINALRSSPGRLETLLWRYRSAGFTDGEIVAAMAASPRLVNPLRVRR